MSVKIILLALETLLLFLFLVPLPVICSGNLLGIIVSVMLMLITANWTKFCGIISKIWGHGAGKFGLIFVSTLILAGIIYVGILSIIYQGLVYSLRQLHYLSCLREFQYHPLQPILPVFFPYFLSSV